MISFYLLWAGCGILLGILYTMSVQEEIHYSQKRNSPANQRNPLFSIARIGICSIVIIYSLSRSILYGLICLAFFLLAKYFSLFAFIKKNNRN